MNKSAKQILAALLALSMPLTLAGCGSDSGEYHATNLTDITTPAQPPAAAEESKPSASHTAAENTSLPKADAVTYTDFALRLFRECSEPGKSTLISPLSVLNALAMTACGAEQETLTQMENVFGSDLTSLCEYLSAYNDALPSGDKYKLHVANSVWIKDDEDFKVEPDFLQADTDYFHADIFQCPFDSTTLKDINSWVSKNTDKMIPKILDQIPDDAVMYLVNALAFDAEWQSIYRSDQVHGRTFTSFDGTEQDAELMYSEEHKYLQGSQAQGFLKYYADGKYAFAALLPDEGVSLDDYLASLTGEQLHQLLVNAEDIKVETAIPKFKQEYSVNLQDILQELGMTDAFDPETADFDGICSAPDKQLYINRVLHKTFIEVDEKGTKAGAATAVEMCEFAMISEAKSVYLDRPFVYMLIDCEELLPVFIGTVTEITP